MSKLNVAKNEMPNDKPLTVVYKRASKSALYKRVIFFKVN